MIYLKGETLDEFKARKGATDMDQYMISRSQPLIAMVIG